MRVFLVVLHWHVRKDLIMLEETDHSSIFDEFMGRRIKIMFRDGDIEKIAKGTLESTHSGFLKIRGEQGVLVVNERNVVRLSPG